MDDWADIKRDKIKVCKPSEEDTEALFILSWRGSMGWWFPRWDAWQECDKPGRRGRSGESASSEDWFHYWCGTWNCEHRPPKVLIDYWKTLKNLKMEPAWK